MAESTHQIRGLDVSEKPTFYEFFAGGGMVRAALGRSWKCLFANDIDRRKAAAYRENWGESELLLADVHDLTANDLPGSANLVWASFPCQDLSLAGGGAGLAGKRSGTFWPFWRIVEELKTQGRCPDVVVLENVCGALTSHGGRDFAAIASAFIDQRFQLGAVVIDARLFVPQSRPRLFIVGIAEGREIPNEIVSDGPNEKWHPGSLQRVAREVCDKSWHWLAPPSPRKRRKALIDVLEESPASVDWHSKRETQKIVSMMNSTHREKLHLAMSTGADLAGAIYKRTRRDSAGNKVQRAEVRFDGIAGCLRTPSGGSSRQLLIRVKGNEVRTRLVSSRETARLMGLRDSYVLPENYNEAYHLTGDGVVVPVVRHLVKNVVEPILETSKMRAQV